MSTSSIEAGRAFLRLLVDNKDFSAGLDEGLRRLKSFGKAAEQIGVVLGGAGAAITAPFVASIKAFSDTGSALNDMQARTGLSAKSLSELKYAAEQTGTSLEVVEKAARELQSKGIDPNKIFEYAKRIAAIEDPTKRAQAAFDAFGKKAGAAILPLLQDLPTLQTLANKMGLVWSEDMVKSADAFGDAIDTLGKQLLSVSFAIGNAVAPTLTEWLETISVGLPVIIDFVHQHGQLVRVIGLVGGALTAMGSGLIALRVATIATTASVNALRTALTLLSRHPYAIAATIAIAALLVVLEPLINKWLGSADANEKANDIAAETAKVQKAVADEVGKTTKAVEDSAKAIDLRTEALRKMASVEEKQAKDRRAKDVDKEIAAIQFENKVLEERYRLQRQGKGPAVGLPVTDAFRASVRQKESGLLQSEQGAFPSLFMPGFTFALNQSILSAFQEAGRQPGRGSSGFSTPEQNAFEKFDKEMRPVLATFSGRLAGQIFGGTTVDPNTRIAQGVEKLVAINSKQRDKLEDIDRNLKLNRFRNDLV